MAAWATIDPCLRSSLLGLPKALASLLGTDDGFGECQQPAPVCLVGLAISSQGAEGVEAEGLLSEAGVSEAGLEVCEHCGGIDMAVGLAQGDGLAEGDRLLHKALLRWVLLSCFLGSCFLGNWVLWNWVLWNWVEHQSIFPGTNSIRMPGSGLRIRSLVRHVLGLFSPDSHRGRGYLRSQISR